MEHLGDSSMLELSSLEILEGWHTYCAQHIQPQPHSMEETIAYLLSIYDAQELAESDRRMQNYIRQWAEHKCPPLVRQREGNPSMLSQQELGLHLRGFRIVLPARSDSQGKEQACFLFVNLDEVSFRGEGMGSKAICDQVMRYLGVEEQDILQRTPRFLAYMNALAANGELPTPPQFQ